MSSSSRSSPSAFSCGTSAGSGSLATTLSSDPYDVPRRKSGIIFETGEELLDWWRPTKAHQTMQITFPGQKTWEQTNSSGSEGLNRLKIELSSPGEVEYSDGTRFSILEKRFSLSHGMFLMPRRAQAKSIDILAGIERNYRWIMNNARSTSIVVDVRREEYALSVFLRNINGVTLNEFVVTNRPPMEIRYSLALQILLHIQSWEDDSGNERFYHLDLKPENILVTRSGTVNVIDFDFGAIASAEGVCPARVPMLSERYAAPEIRSRPVRPHALSDLWSWATIVSHDIFGDVLVTDEPLLPRDLVMATLSSDPGKRPSLSLLIQECRLFLQPIFPAILQDIAVKGYAIPKGSKDSVKSWDGRTPRSGHRFSSVEGPRLSLTELSRRLALDEDTLADYLQMAVEHDLEHDGPPPRSGWCCCAW